MFTEQTAGSGEGGGRLPDADANEANDRGRFRAEMVFFAGGFVFARVERLRLRRDVGGDAEVEVHRVRRLARGRVALADDAELERNRAEAKGRGRRNGFCDGRGRDRAGAGGAARRFRNRIRGGASEGAFSEGASRSRAPRERDALGADDPPPGTHARESRQRRLRRRRVEPRLDAHVAERQRGARPDEKHRRERPRVLLVGGRVRREEYKRVVDANRSPSARELVLPPGDLVREDAPRLTEHHRAARLVRVRVRERVRAAPDESEVAR